MDNQMITATELITTVMQSAQLTHSQIEIIELVYVRSMSIEEVAVIMGITADATERTLRKAYSSLLEMIIEYGTAYR